MVALTRWSPLTPMFQLRREIDDLFGKFFGQSTEQGGQSGWGTWWPEVEGGLEEGNYVIRVALPGVDPKDVEVSMIKNVLTIRGQRRAQRESKAEDYFVRELSYGGFERSFTLPEGADAGKINARYTNGMLEIKVPAPKAEAPQKVNIEVEGGSPPKAVKAA
jgi:HSP20 family protein